MVTRHQVPYWYLSPRFIVNKVREKGVAVCANTYLELLRSNVCRFTRPIRTKLWSIPDNIWYSNKKQPDVLYAFYDLAVSPATFDIVPFLVLAELERKEVGCSSLHVVIVPGYHDGFRVGNLDMYKQTGTLEYDNDFMHWKLRNLLMPCCWLIPSCKQLTVCTSREEALVLEASLAKHVYPKKERSTIHCPQEGFQHFHLYAAISQGSVLPSIRPTSQACNFVSDWIQMNAGNRKVITITLKEGTYQIERNSNIEDWGAFARSLDPNIYFPVIVRDTESALKPLPFELKGLTIFTEAPWNIELRAALYELSYLNMSVANGPHILCSLNHQTRYLMFKIVTPSWKEVGIVGLEPYSQLKFATPFQRFVWEDDNLEVIQREFKDMCDQIERSSVEKI